MANIKISDLAAATAVAGSDSVVIVQGGATKKVAVGLLPGPIGGPANALTAAGTLAPAVVNTVDATAGAFTVTLPAPTKVGQQLVVEKVDASLNAVTITGTLRGVTATVNLPGIGVASESVTFEAESLTSWRPIASHKPKGWLDALYAPSAPQFHGVRYTAFGHSFGQLTTPPNVWPGGRYPERLRDLLHADTGLYVNRTVAGSLMSGAASVATSNWTDGNGGLVTLMANQNDVGNHTAVATFKAAFRSFLTTMLGSTGKPPTVLVVKDTTSTSTGYARYSTPPTDADVAAYNGYLDDVIAEFPAGWIIVANPMADGWNPATMTCPDGQHPNDRGMAFLANSILKALSSAPYRPGQNVGFATPLITSNAAPSALTLAATAGNGQVTVSATGGSGATSFALYRGTTATGTPIATSFPFTDTGLTNGTAYSYTATATNGSGSVTSNTVSATPSASALTITDSFNRADSSTSLGSTDTGQAWTLLSTGSVFGISSNKAYRVSNGSSPTNEDYAVIDTGKSDFDMSLTVSTAASGGSGPLFRATDASNLYVIDNTTTGGIKLYKRVAGTYTALATLSATGSSGAVLRVVASGSTITCYLNGSQVAQVTDTFNQTGTKHGFRIAGSAANGAAVRLDDFSFVG